jgi:hypothetical protein
MIVTAALLAYILAASLVGFIAAGAIIGYAEANPPATSGNPILPLLQCTGWDLAAIIGLAILIAAAICIFTVGASLWPFVQRVWTSPIRKEENDVSAVQQQHRDCQSPGHHPGEIPTGDREGADGAA